MHLVFYSDSTRGDCQLGLKDVNFDMEIYLSNLVLWQIRNADTLRDQVRADLTALDHSKHK